MTGLPETLEGALRDAGHWVSGVTAEVGSASWPVGAAVVAAGLLLLLVGARARRPVAILGAAAFSALAVHAFLLRGGVVPGASPAVLAVAAAAAGAALAALLPPVFPALAGAVPLALLADVVAPEGHRLEVAAFGAAVGLVLGFLAARLMAAGLASFAGALAVAVGVAGVLRSAGIGRTFTAHPLAILAATAILGVAGTAFQYATAWGRGAGGAKGKGKGPAPLQGPDGKPA